MTEPIETDSTFEDFFRQNSLEHVPRSCMKRPRGISFGETDDEDLGPEQKKPTMMKYSSTRTEDLEAGEQPRAESFQGDTPALGNALHSGDGLADFGIQQQSAMRDHSDSNQLNFGEVDTRQIVAEQEKRTSYVLQGERAVHELYRKTQSNAAETQKLETDTSIAETEALTTQDLEKETITREDQFLSVNREDLSVQDDADSMDKDVDSRDRDRTIPEHAMHSTGGQRDVTVAVQPAQLSFVVVDDDLGSQRDGWMKVLATARVRQANLEQTAEIERGQSNAVDDRRVNSRRAVTNDTQTIENKMLQRLLEERDERIADLEHQIERYQVYDSHHQAQHHKLKGERDIYAQRNKDLSTRNRELNVKYNTKLKEIQDQVLRSRDHSSWNSPTDGRIITDLKAVERAINGIVRAMHLNSDELIKDFMDEIAAQPHPLATKAGRAYLLKHGQDKNCSSIYLSAWVTNLIYNRVFKNPFEFLKYLRVNGDVRTEADWNNRALLFTELLAKCKTLVAFDRLTSLTRSRSRQAF